MPKFVSGGSSILQIERRYVSMMRKRAGKADFKMNQYRPDPHIRFII
jgi:hypothetical protein